MILKILREESEKGLELYRQGFFMKPEEVIAAFKMVYDGIQVRYLRRPGVALGFVDKSTTSAVMPKPFQACPGAAVAGAGGGPLFLSLSAPAGTPRFVAEQDDAAIEEEEGSRRIMGVMKRSGGSASLANIAAAPIEAATAPLDVDVTPAWKKPEL